MKQGMPFRWSKQKSVCGISVVKREIAAVFTAAISIFGGPEEDRTPEPFGCEPNALPAELRAHIGHFSIKKVAKNGFLRYSILREKSEIPEEKLEGKIGPMMCVHMDANAALSQLSYEPKLILQRQMLLYHNFLHCKDCFFQKDENFLLPICR